MKRTQIYLDEAQHNFLENLAFIISRKKRKKISISEMIRTAIDLLQEKYPPDKVESEMDVILNSPLILEGIKKARRQKRLLSHEDVFGDK